MKTFECYECGEPAFMTGTGITHHGAPDEINYRLDAGHVALDPAQFEPSIPSARDS